MHPQYRTRLLQRGSPLVHDPQLMTSQFKTAWTLIRFENCCCFGSTLCSYLDIVVSFRLCIWGVSIGTSISLSLFCPLYRSYSINWNREVKSFWCLQFKLRPIECTD